MKPVSTSIDSRQAILGAAKHLFSEFGYNGVSVADIAREAGVTKSLVMYHWPTKEQLWHDVVDSALGPYMELIERFGANDPSVSLEAVIRSAIAMHRNNPELTRMWTWMSLDRQTIIEEKKLCKGQAAIERVRSEGAALGMVPGVDPVMATTLLMAAIDGWFCFRSQFEKVTGAETMTDQAIDQFTEAVLKVFLGQAQQGSKSG